MNWKEIFTKDSLAILGAVSIYIVCIGIILYAAKLYFATSDIFRTVKTHTKEIEQLKRKVCELEYKG